MKKLLIAILFVLVTVSGFCAGTTTETSEKYLLIGSIKAGPSAQKLQSKTLSLVASTTAGISTTVAHGLTSGENIRMISTWAVSNTGTDYWPESHSRAADGLEYYASADNTNIRIFTTAANSTYILGSTIYITIWYVVP